MNSLINKISLTLATYSKARAAIHRQSNYQELINVQNAKLRRLVHFAGTHIKYYQEAFQEAGVDPQQIKSAADLVNVPILTKQQLKERFWDFLPRDLPPCRVSRTSGSTGTPVCILSDRNSRCCNSAAVIRYRRALGIPFIGRAIVTPLKTAQTPARRPHWTFLQGVHKTYYVNPYTEDSTDIAAAQRTLTSLKKPALIGITPAIRKLAHCVQDGILPEFWPSVIIPVGEVLTEQMRKMMQSVFQAKVADIYGCNEAGDVAWQCLEGGHYHINIDNVIVEVLTDGKPAVPGQIGEVVITNLNRYAMPIIRYKNGDLARLSTQDCPCGCKLPMIAEIIGRSGEDITLPTGRIIPWNELKSLMNHPQIRQFQIIQNAKGDLLIKYIKEPNADKLALDELLKSRYRRLLNNMLPIETDCVNRIDPAPSGKSKLVISYYECPTST